MPMTDAELLDKMNRFVPPTAALLGQELLEVDSAAGGSIILLINSMFDRARLMKGWVEF